MTITTVLLILHVVAGFTSLITGGIASFTRKGGQAHRASGKWYFWGMTGVFVTAIAVSILKSLAFLFMIGFFSYYFVVRGYRMLYLKGLGRSQKAGGLDWFITAIALLFGIGLVGWAITQKLNGNSFWPVPFVFGIVSGSFAVADMRLYIKGPGFKQHWLAGHIVSMGAGYIATWTAFVVTNVKFLPPVFVWLAPSVIGSVFIFLSLRRYIKPAKAARLTAVAASLLAAICTNAQPVDSVYTLAYLKRSTSFAWLTLGGDVHVLPGGSFTASNGQRQSFGTAAEPRFTISGMHFWGHADFYVSIALPVSLANPSASGKEIRYQNRVETGARFYPWKVKPQSLRPYAGIAFRSLAFSALHKTDAYHYPASDYDKMVFPLQAGLTYTSKKYHLNAGVNYWRQPTVSYYTGPSAITALGLRPYSFNIGLVRYMDTDRSMRSAKAVREQNILHSRLKQYRKLDTWYAGIGPSAALPLQRSPFLKRYAPALAQSLPFAILPDLTLGYHFAKPDVNVGLSYRPIINTIKGYDDKVKTVRHSVMTESYKFLFNWLGFAPYLGPTFSMEHLQVNHNGMVSSGWKPAVGLIAGWDIRVTRTGTSLLRTNLRWVPNLHLNVKGEKVMFDALEFNFIQYVVFLGRKKFYRQQFEA